MRRKHHRHREDAEINITPMLDIVFIMLIFFIVTTSFVKETVVDVTRPDSTPRQLRDLSEVIAVRISDAGAIQVDERPVDIRAVRANIETALAARPDSAVVVIAQRDADVGIVVRVIDSARLAGAPQVSLAAQAQ